MKKRTVLLIAVLAVALGATVLLPVLSISKYSDSARSFSEDGYMLVANTDGSSEAVNVQYYFNGGDKYRESYDDLISFEDINGIKVSASKENFLHYNSGSLQSLATTVLLDTDKMEGDQVAYYSINSTTVLNKSSNSYSVNNAGENLSFSNFVWKVSDSLYMIVSEEVKLIVNSQEELTFSGYVEVQYIDEGVVHLVNQSGTYSTISSDAYLELSNGIRIYVGSKNISDSEGILMNMTQMVVNSDDNIEVIPDEEYTNEDDTVSQVIVNASDGADGESGDSGDAGQAGDNGTNGSKGANGNKGNSITEAGEKGKSADNADIVYTQEVMPVFSNVQISTLAYGADFYFNYDYNSCNVYNAWLSVIEDATGIEVWRMSITEFLSPTIKLPNYCRTLRQSTTYNLVIGATYTSDTQLTHVSQNLYSQKFITESLGVSITKLYATTNEIVLKLNKTQESDIQEVYVEYYDSNLQLLGLGYLGGEEEDSSQTIFDFENLDAGNYYEVVFDGLDSDSAYYMLICIKTMQSKIVDGEETKIAVIPASSFEKQKFYTLKRDPEIEAPTISINEETSSFIVSPGKITDIDNGISSYIYELYSVEGYGDDADPIYSTEKSTANPISIPIEESMRGEGKAYVAKIKARFYNNYEEIIFESPLSDVICPSSSIWPSIFVSIEDNDLHPSAVEGKILIDDSNGTLGKKSIITLTYKTTLPDTVGLSDDERYVSRQIMLPFELQTYARSDAGIITVPFTIKGLKSGLSYTIVATSSKITTDSGVYTDALIGTTTFSTTEYTKMEATLVDLEDSEQKISYALNFNATDPIHQLELAEESENYSGTFGLTTLDDENGKAMTYVKVELYGSDNHTIGDKVVYTINTTNKLGEFTVADDDKVTTSDKYAENYDFNSSIYKKAFKNTVSGMTSEEEEMMNESLCVTSWATGTEAVLYLAWPTGSSAPDNIVEVVPAGKNAIVNVEKFDTYFKLSFTMPNYPLELTFYDGSHTVGSATIGRSDHNEKGSISDGFTLLTEYKEEYKTIIINDDMFKDEYTNPLSGIEAGDHLFVVITVYDYTFGRYKDDNVNGKSNQILLKTDTFEIEAKAQLPRSISDYCGESCLLTNFKASTNLKSNDKYYNLTESTQKAAHPSNLTNGDDLPTGAYKNYMSDLWDSIGTSTYVGIEYQGPQTLASYCSKNEASVRYIVHSTSECTDSDIIADSGWLEYVYDKFSNNELPKWTFFTDITDKTTGLSVERGETFYIETRIKMQHYNNKEYPTDFRGTVLANNFVVMEAYCIEKEEPSIRMIPYDCDASVTNGVRASDILYYSVNDPDMALDYDVTKITGVPAGTTKTLYITWDNNVTVPDSIEEDGTSLATIDALSGCYKLTFTMPTGSISFKLKKDGKVLATIKIGNSSSTTSTTNKHYYAVEDQRRVKFYDTEAAGYVSGGNVLNADGYYELNCSLSADKPVTAKFKVVNDAQEYSTLELVTEQGLMNEASVTMIQKPEDFVSNTIDPSGIWDEMSEDERSILIHFLYTTHDPYSELTKAELLCVDIIFTNKVSNKTKTLSFIYPVPDETHDYTVSGQSGTYHFYQANLEIKVTDIAEIIDGNDINYNVICYFDSSKYGYKYLNETTTNPYYLVEKTGDAGKGYYSSSTISEYPANCYTESEIPTGIEDKTVTSYMHKKSGVVIPDVDSNTITFENQAYSIQPYGIDGKVIKNTGSVSRNKDTSNLRYALPIYEETSAIVGFSTFKHSFTITAGHTLLDEDDGKTLKIYYQKQPKAGDNNTYNWQSKNIKFEDGQVKFEHIVNYLDPDTTYKYYISATVMDNGNEKEVMISNSIKEFTTISKYEHETRDTLVLEAEKKGRNNKTLVYTCNIDDIVVEDMQRALTYITFELLDRDGNVLKSDQLPISTLFETETKDGKTTYKYFTLEEGSQYLGNIVYEHVFDFKPLAKGVGKDYADHQLDDDAYGSLYQVRTTYTYDSQYNASDTPQTKRYYFKAFAENYVSFSMVAQSGITTDTENQTLNFYLKYYISGADTKRIIPLSSNNAYLIAELIKVDSNNNEEVVCIDGVYQRLLITATINENGYVSCGSGWYQFDNLESGTAYRLKIYTKADTNNVNIGTFNIADISTSIRTEANPDILDPDKLAERNILVKESAIKYTEQSTSVRVSDLYLYPNSPTQHIVYGQNLEKVRMIVYTYRSGTDETNTVTYDSSEITSKFSSLNPHLYYLSMPEIDLKYASSFSVRVDFYESESQTEPSSSIEATYGSEE